VSTRFSPNREKFKAKKQQKQEEMETRKVRKSSAELVQEVNMLNTLKEFDSATDCYNYCEPHFKSRFVEYQVTLMQLCLAYTSQENIILYGPPGHGKSEMVTLFAALMHDKGKAWVKSMSSESTTADLFGGIDINAMNEEGAIIYRTHAGFGGAKIAILEEALDAPVDVLMALKDALTSKQIRNGEQTDPVLTQMIIICTNKEPNDVAEDDASKALIERFIFQYRVAWPDYQSERWVNYVRFIVGLYRKDISNKIKDKEAKGERVSEYYRYQAGVSNSFLDGFAAAVASCCRRGNTLSPRLVAKAIKVVMQNKGSFSSIEHCGIPRDVINDIAKHQQEQAAINDSKNKVLDIFNRFKKQLSDFNIRLTGQSTIKEMETAKKAVEDTVTKFINEMNNLQNVHEAVHRVKNDTVESMKSLGQAALAVK
jgi:energy-coupling factor transporter ATP-binding protein EcfA2